MERATCPGLLNGSEGVQIGFWRRRSPPNPQQVCLFTKHLEIDRGACPQIGMQTGLRLRPPRAVSERANGLPCKDPRAPSLPPLRCHRPSIDADRPAARGSSRDDVGRTFGTLDDWTIPATRTKNGNPHLVPLSQPTRELLHALPSDGPGDVRGAHRRAKLGLVFPGERGTPLAAGRKPSQRSTCAGRLRQGCSASAFALKSPRRC